MSENLNDIFTTTMNETLINDTPAVNAIDGIVVEIVNSANGARHSYTLYPENTLNEVLDVCKVDLGLASSSGQLNFEFNGVTYADSSLTVEKIGLVNGGKLLIHPNGMVAACLAA